MAKKSRKIIKSIKVIIINILVFISIIGLMELFFFYKDRNETIVNCNMDMNDAPAKTRKMNFGYLKNLVSQRFTTSNFAKSDFLQERHE